MTKRVIIFLALVALAVSHSDAGNPLALLRIKKRVATRARRANPIPAHILRSPKEMTKLFGPSILIHQPEAKNKELRFVRQPG